MSDIKFEPVFFGQDLKLEGAFRLLEAAARSYGTDMLEARSGDSLVLHMHIGKVRLSLIRSSGWGTELYQGVEVAYEVIHGASSQGYREPRHVSVSELLETIMALRSHFDTVFASDPQASIHASSSSIHMANRWPC